VVNGHAVGAYKATGYVPHLLVKLAAPAGRSRTKLFTARTIAEVVPLAQDTEADGPALFDPFTGGTGDDD